MFTIGTKSDKFSFPASNDSTLKSAIHPVEAVFENLLETKQNIKNMERKEFSSRGLLPRRILIQGAVMSGCGAGL